MIAVATGYLTAPGPLHLLALGHPNTMVSQYPMVLFSVFAIPISSVLHGVCLWRLGRWHATVSDVSGRGRVVSANPSSTSAWRRISLAIEIDEFFPLEFSDRGGSRPGPDDSRSVATGLLTAMHDHRARTLQSTHFLSSGHRVGSI